MPIGGSPVRFFLLLCSIFFCVTAFARPRQSQPDNTFENLFTKTKETEAAAARRNYNIRANLLTYDFRSLAANFDIRVGRKLTIGPQVGFSLWGYTFYNTTWYSLGVRANYALNDDVFANGVYIGPYFTYNGYSIGSASYLGSSLASAHFLDLGSLVGYQLFLPNNLNFLAGLGLGLFVGQNSIASYTGAHLNLELSIGYAF